MARAWVYQLPKQVEKIGEKLASWYCGYYDPEGKQRCKSCGAGPTGKRNAVRLARRVEGQLAAGTYQSPGSGNWDAFRKEYEGKVLAALALPTQDACRSAMDHFERIVKPRKMAAIKTNTIDSFKAKRSLERGKHKGELISPASVNQNLRHLKAALRKAHEWGYLPAVPKFTMLKEPKKLPTFVTPEHFAAIYAACERAKRPAVAGIAPADWWRGLLVMAYMTGWRIGELLALRREDVDLEQATAITRADAHGNKAKTDELIPLHPAVVEHLRPLAAINAPLWFPWPHDRRTLDVDFHAIQRASGIKLPCRKSHEHTPACHCYGFHDLRRGFASMNAGRLTGDALQRLMRHQSYQTTQRYINLTRQIADATASLYVPPVLATATQSQPSNVGKLPERPISDSGESS